MKKILFVFVILFSITNTFAQKTKLMIQTGHQTYVQNMSLSPDETKVISIDSDGIGILWDLVNGKKLRVFQNIRDAQFDTDGSALFLVFENGEFKSVDLAGNVTKAYPTSTEKSRPEIATYNREAGLIFYRGEVTKVNTGNLTKMNADKYSFTTMLYAPLKGQVVWGSRAKEANVYFFDVNSGSVTKSLQLDLGEYVAPNNFSITKNNNTLLVSTTRKANVLDFSSGTVLKVLEPKDIYNDIQSSVISPDGNLALFVMKKGMTMIDIETQKILWEQAYNDYDYNKAIFNANGDKVIVVHNGALDIVNSKSGNPISIVSAIPLRNLTGFQLANNNTNLFTMASDQYVVNWDLASGRMEKPVSFESAKNAVAYAITPNGKEMIFTDYDYPNSRIAQVKFTDNTKIVQYPKVEAGSSIKNIGLSFDNKYLFSSRLLLEKDAVTYPKSLSVYEVSTKNKILDLPATTTGGAFANTKNTIATKNGWNNGNISFYDVPSGQLLNQVTLPHNVSDYDPILFSPTDKYLASNYNVEYCIYELATQKHIQFRDRTSVGVRGFTPDEKYFFVGSNVDGCIYFYDIVSQQYESAFKMQVTSVKVKGVSFSKDGKIMYTADADNTIKVWNFETKTLLATLYSFPNTNDWAVVTPDGHFDGTKGAQEKMYYVKNVNTIDLSDLYEKFYTPNLLQRLLAGENINKEDVDIDNIHPKPRTKISYEQKTRNLTVVDDNVKPTYANTTGLAEVTVNAKADEDVVEEIRLFHNGKIVNLSTRGLFVTDNATGNETKKYTINLLPGENTFRAVALNSQRTESKADEIIVSYSVTGSQPPQQPIPQLVQNNTTVVTISPVDKTATMYLMVVGINAYTNKINPLTYALPDATAFKDEIEKDAKSILANVKTYFITDAKANREGIINVFNEIKKDAKPQDVFVFYYAGHGYISPTNKEFYLVSADVADGGESLLKNGIPAKDLQQYAVDIQAQKQLFILDACQSAGAFDAMLKHDGEQQKSLAVVARSTGTHWMAASGSTETAKEFGELGHGAFTYVLLQALKGQAAANKMITVNGMKNFLQVQVPELVKKYGSNNQYPASYGFGNDFPVEVIK